jgi:Zn finger protein HypA/HybF involved in hydrogenase expression
MNQPFPPPNFIVTESAVPGIEVYRPAPEKEEEHRETVAFNCPQCHAATAYSARDGGLTCTHCGYYEPPQKEVVGKGAEEFEFTVATMERAAHGWGVSRKELQCQNCGAYTSVPLDLLTHTCPFCDSNRVIQREAPQDVLRPRFVIPFKIEAIACQTIARDWLGSSWMTPKALQNVASVETFVGVYLPFWTFDAVTDADWKAEVGHTETETYYENGEQKTRTVTVWRWESGHVRRDFDDLVVEGTARLSKLLLDRIKEFNLNELAPYEPTYLAGFQAQSYDVGLEQAWEEGRHDMREQTRQSCRGQASTGQIRNFSMNLTFSNESWRYILLPIYLANYQYGEKRFQVMVNGQSGAISGQRPVDWGKVWLAIIGLVSPGLLLGLLGLGLTYFGRAAFPIAVAGFILFIIGLVVGIGIFVTAHRMDDA